MTHLPAMRSANRAGAEPLVFVGSPRVPSMLLSRARIGFELALGRLGFGACWPRNGYAQAAKSVPQKQQFRKRFKDAVAAAAASQTGGTTQLTQREALTDALFKVTNVQTPPSAEADSEVIAQRAFISKAWSRWQMMQLHGQSQWERALVQSKIDAMRELEKVSPELAKIARAPDYSIPPAHRRLPTETPPDPAKFPLSMLSTEFNK